jgi:hypothetical protein
MQKIAYTGYFTSDNERGRVENATHNTLERKPGHGGDKYTAFLLMWVAFSIPPGSLALVKYPVDIFKTTGSIGIQVLESILRQEK